MTLLPDSLKAHIQYLIAKWCIEKVDKLICRLILRNDIWSFVVFRSICIRPQLWCLSMSSWRINWNLKQEVFFMKHSKCQISRCTHVSLDYLSRLMSPDQSAKKGSWVKKSNRSCFRVQILKRHLSFSLMLSNWIGIVRGDAKRTTVYFYLVCNRIWSQVFGGHKVRLAHSPLYQPSPSLMPLFCPQLLDHKWGISKVQDRSVNEEGQPLQSKGCDTQALPLTAGKECSLGSSWSHGLEQDFNVIITNIIIFILAPQSPHPHPQVE